MRLASFRRRDDPSGSVLGGEIRDEMVVAFDGGEGVLDRLRSGDRRPATGPAFPLAEVELRMPHAPPVLYGVGRNYAAHAAELGNEPPGEPLVFTMPPTAAGHPDDPVSRGRLTARLDYEAELAVVLGTLADGAVGVAGYAVADDVSARDLQASEEQWTRAKGSDGWCPFGPWITTVDEVPDPHALRIRSWVDGEPRQDASTADMVFRVPRIVDHLRAAITLRPGDLVLTGTPAGVGHGLRPPRYLEPGQVVRVEIEGLGAIQHAIAP